VALLLGIAGLYLDAASAAGQVQNIGRPCGVDPCQRFISEDGSRIAWETAEQLVPADTDSAIDVYEKAGEETVLVSVGAAGNDPADAVLQDSSLDGERYFFATAGAMTADDGDDAIDIFERSGGSTTRVTEWSSHNIEYGIASVDGSHFLYSAEGTVYDWNEGAQDEVSVREPGVSPRFDWAFPAAISLDGSRLFFSSNDPFTTDDHDNRHNDVYERTNGDTILRTGPAGGYTPDHHAYLSSTDVTPDGSTVYFATSSQLSPQDTDDGYDLYVNDAAGTRLFLGSSGISGNPGASLASSSWPNPPRWPSTSSDGASVVFASTAQLTPEDQDNEYDLYRRVGADIELVSARGPGASGPNRGIAGSVHVSADTNRVAWTTAGRLVGADTDEADDVYGWDRGQLRMLSAPAGSDPFASRFRAYLAGMSANGDNAYIQTAGRMTSEDTDGEQDLFEATTSGLGFVAFPGAGASGFDRASYFEDVSGDGEHVVFATAARLVAADTDGIGFDLYERTGGVTRLLTGPVTVSPDQGGVAGGFGRQRARIHRLRIPRATARVARAGAMALASCDLECRLTVEVRVPKSIAARLGLRSTLVGRGTRNAEAGKRHWVVVRIAPSARASLLSYDGRVRFKARAFAEAPAGSAAARGGGKP
jgi:hypothetical protein